VFSEKKTNKNTTRSSENYCISKGQSHCLKIISMTNEFARSPSDYQLMKRSSRRSLLAAGLFLRTTGTELRIRASRGPAAIPYY